jgi:hypothetical protein
MGKNGMAGERHGNGMVCVNQKRPHCVNQMGKNGMAGERHGNGMVFVNPPLLDVSHATHKNVPNGQVAQFGMLKQAVHIVTTVL